MKRKEDALFKRITDFVATALRSPSSASNETETSSFFEQQDERFAAEPFPTEIKTIDYKLENERDLSKLKYLLDLSPERQAELSPNQRQWLIHLQGRLLLESSKWEEALALWQPLQAQNLELELQAYLASDIAFAYFCLGRFTPALEQCQTALIAYRGLKDYRGEAQALNNLGVLYARMEKWGDALDFHRKSLEIRRKLNDRQGEAISLLNIGNLHYLLGKWSAATKEYEDSLSIFQAIDDPVGKNNTTMCLARLYQSQGDWLKAFSHYQAGLVYLQSLNKIEEQ